MMASSKRFLYVILSIVLVLCMTGCIRAASGHPVISSTGPEIHERTPEGEYLDSVSFQKRIDIANWAYGWVMISLLPGYVVALMVVFVIRRKPLNVRPPIILALLVIFIFCENLNFRKVESFFMASLDGPNQPTTVVVKRHTAWGFFPLPVWYQTENTSTVIWTPFANLLVNQMIKQSEQ